MKTQLAFLVGCPRSGTTLLQSLLASHPKVFSLQETKFFENIIPTYEKKRLFFGLASRYAKRRIQNFFDDIDAPEYGNRFPSIISSSGRYTHVFFDVMSEITQKNGKSIFLEKTPNHINFISYIERYLPSAKVVHIIRNGEDVVASFYELVKKYPDTWGYGDRGLSYCIQKWISAVEKSEQCLKKTNHAFVNYEKLLDNPEAELRRICRFLEVSFSAEMLENYSSTGKKLVENRETWKERVATDIQAPQIRKFDVIFSDAEKTTIRNSIQCVDVSDRFQRILAASSDLPSSSLLRELL